MRTAEETLLEVTERHTGTGYTAPCLIEALEEYANEKVKAAEEKFEKNYKRFKREYKAQADAECLSIALSHAEDDIRRKEFPKVVKVALQTASNEVRVIYHDGTTKQETNHNYVNIGNNHVRPNRTAILYLEQVILEKLNLK